MVSVERILEYSDLPPEAPSHTDLIPPVDWPTSGEIEFNNLSMTYPNTSRKVLNDISLHIPAGTKVGIVGRTGAGKSSLLQVKNHINRFLLENLDAELFVLLIFIEY